MKNLANYADDMLLRYSLAAHHDDVYAGCNQGLILVVVDKCAVKLCAALPKPLSGYKLRSSATKYLSEIATTLYYNSQLVTSS